MSNQNPSASYFGSLISTGSLSDSLRRAASRPQLTRRPALLLSPPRERPPPPDSREKCEDPELVQLLERAKQPPLLLEILTTRKNPETGENADGILRSLVKYYPDDFFKSLVILFNEHSLLHNNANEACWRFLQMINTVLPHCDSTSSEPDDLSYGSWRIIVTTLGEWLRSSREDLQIVAITLVGRLLRWGANGLLRGDEFDAALHNILNEKLTSGTVSLQLKTIAVQTSFACILHLYHEFRDKKFQDLLKIMMDTVFINGRIVSDMRYTQVVMMGLTEVAKVNTGFLLKQIDRVLEFIVTVIEDSGSDGLTVGFANKFLSTLGEQRKPPGRPSVGISYVQPKILEITEAIERRSEEQKPDFSDIMQEYSKLVTRMGVLVLESLHTPQFSWKRNPYAAVLFFAAAQVCTKDIKPNLYLLVQPVVHFLKHDDEDIRGGAITAIQSMIKKLQPQVHTQFHGIVVPALMERITTDSGFPKIQVEAVKALCHFAETCRPDIFALYLDKVLSTLLTCLKIEGPTVQNSVIDAIPGICNSVKKHHTRKHEEQVLESLTKCIGCNLCKNDAVTRKAISLLVNMISKQHEPKPDDLSNRVDLIIQAWWTLWEKLGEGFKDYLEDAVPQLLSFIELDYEETSESYQNRVRSMVLDERTSACVLLTILADVFGKDLGPWNDQAIKSFIPLLILPGEAGLFVSDVAMRVFFRAYREAKVEDS